MPNHTVSGNVDTMMRAADNAAIRSAIGVGQTDAPTFAGVTAESAVLTNLFSASISTNLRYAVSVTGTAAGVKLSSVLSLGWSNDGNQLNTIDTILARDAPGILAQRNGVNAQAFRVYNTYTDASNYERGVFDFRTTTNELLIGTQQLGTGVGRDVVLTTNGSIRFQSGAAPRWVVSNGGHFLAWTDNAYDIGAIGANRPRTIYAANGIDAGSGSISTFSAVRAVSYSFTPAGHGTSSTFALYSPSDGVLRITNGATTDFNRLQLGGTTSAFPAIKRNGTGIDIVLADNSEFAPISSLYQRFGTNTPEGAVTAPIGAVYHRTDSGAHSKFYVKESGSGPNGWVGK